MTAEREKQPSALAKWAVGIALALGVGNVPTTYYVTEYRVQRVEHDVSELREQSASKMDRLDDRLRSIEQGIARIEGRLQKQGD